ncbi:TetR/AcrR family transcriptional regulator [Qaidamihabitans albus]|uniref:TetR/AcrR family transcriptional regulator n=1 Tax=Qaidamihabitans albus TaxID=2795733 RepID=UPI0018F16D04|nr:TetR/AcrR family transcriptional regulator [Qaidamihabitans albus]
MSAKNTARNSKHGKHGTSDDSGISRRRRAAQAEGQHEYRARRAAIVRVAAEVFAEKGFEGAKLADIAERFGIDRASLYYYVGNKNELFRDGVEGVTDGNVAKGEEILKLPLPARERLQLLVEHLLDSYERSYPYVHVYMQQDVNQVAAVLGEEWSNQMLRKLRRLQSITMQLIAEGIDEGTFRPDMRTDLATNALFGMLNWTHRWYKPGRSTSARDVAAAFSSIFFDGMTVRD